MMNEIIINKKMVKSNKSIGKIQMQNRGKRFYFRLRYPKARIPKIIKCNGFQDLLINIMIKNNVISSEKDILKEIEMFGLKGRSGNGVYTYKKFETFMKSNNKNKKIIINSIECDPGLIHDEWLLNNKGKEIVEGVHVLQIMFDTKEVILARRDSSVINNLDIKTVSLPNLYPLGEEHILIRKVLGINLSKNQIPAQNGILVINLQTVLAIQEISNCSFIEGSKHITVADYTTGEAMVARIKSGMKAIKVLQDVLGVRAGKVMFTGGGILAGAHLLNENELITEEINFIAYGKLPHFSNIDTCKKCGSCSRNCPMSIAVKDIITVKAKNIKAKNIKADVSAHRADSCIKCGTCTYLCNAGINVMQYVSDEMIEKN